VSDNMNEVLQELSALLRRISDQNDATLKRQQELQSKMEGRRDVASKLREDSEQRMEQFKLKMEEARSNSQKNKEMVDRHRDEDVQFRERLLETLEHQNELLETLITKLKENPKKG
jgi:hypothetical protein